MDDVTWTRRAHDRDLSRLEMCHVTMWRRVFGRVKVKMYRYTLIVINFISKTKWPRDRHLRDLRLQVTWKKNSKFLRNFKTSRQNFRGSLALTHIQNFKVWKIFLKFSRNFEFSKFCSKMGENLENWISGFVTSGVAVFVIFLPRFRTKSPLFSSLKSFFLIPLTRTSHHTVPNYTAVHFLVHRA